MNIRIRNEYHSQIPIDIQTMVRHLLDRVPKEHLLGLEEIILLDRLQHSNCKKWRGAYWKKNHLPARIELGIELIFKGMPKMLFFCPFISKFMIANILFHEIGHHYQQFTHGVSKKAEEEFAENYKKKMLKKAFFWWRLFLLPLSPLVHFLNKQLEKK